MIVALCVGVVDRFEDHVEVHWITGDAEALEALSRTRSLCARGEFRLDHVRRGSPNTVVENGRCIGFAELRGIACVKRRPPRLNYSFGGARLLMINRCCSS